MGYPNVHIASNGVEALEKCREHSFKVLFLDWNMPEMDGMNFLQKYRNELNIRNTAVVMLTALSDKKSILTALETCPQSLGVL